LPSERASMPSGAKKESTTSLNSPSAASARRSLGASLKVLSASGDEEDCFGTCQSVLKLQVVLLWRSSLLPSMSAPAQRVFHGVILTGFYLPSLWCYRSGDA